MEKVNVLVLGSGISGLSTAYRLLQAGHSVTIWSKEGDGFPPTSLNAYAFWLPVCADDPRVERWANETLTEFRRISPIADSGISLRDAFEMKVKREEPWYAGRLSGIRHALPREIPEGYLDAHVIEPVPVIDPPVYLTWLRRQILAQGGRFRQAAMRDLHAAPRRYQVVVNCSGLAARELVGDGALHAARLQVVKIEHNGFDRIVFDSEGPNKLACIVPHRDYIKLGAIYDERDESLTVDEAETQRIIERCSKMVPGFKTDLFKVLSVTRCLRPKRHATRVEAEKLGKSRLVVHNYGHNGTGYIVSFGAAQEVVSLVQAHVEKKAMKTSARKPVVKTIHEPGMGTLEVFPLKTSEQFLFKLFKDLFENHWHEMQFGILIQGSVLEYKPPAKPEKVALFDGYLTVELGNWHMHVCLGENKGLGCEPTDPAVAAHRRPSRAELYRKLNRHGEPTFWGLRLYNGKNEQLLTVFLPNPLLTSQMQYAKTPDWSKLALWDYLRKEYAGLPADPKDRLAVRFSHD